MKASIKARWVKALRSGEYKQGRGSLKSATGYCCLGVLASIVDPDMTTWDGREGAFASHGDARQIKLIGQEIAPTVIAKLTTMNDGSSNTIRARTFKAIASWIEKSKAL